MEIALSNPVREQKAIPDGVVGMIFLLAAEIMFFAGLISAYIVNRAGALAWPPLDQPRLPVEVTAVNTVILIASAVTIFLFGKKFKSTDGKKSPKLLLATIVLGLVFLFVQGSEWIRLVQFGLTTTSSLYGAFFYLIIGAHAIHAVAGLAILLYLFRKIKHTPSPETAQDKIKVCSIYWYFVVGIWPVLYALVYLM